MLSQGLNNRKEVTHLTFNRPLAKQEETMEKKLVDLLTALNMEFDDRTQFLILQVLAEPGKFIKFAKRRDAILKILTGKCQSAKAVPFGVPRN